MSHHDRGVSPLKTLAYADWIHDHLEFSVDTADMYKTEQEHQALRRVANVHPTLSFVDGPQDVPLLTATVDHALLEQVEQRSGAVAIVSDHETLSKTFGELNDDVHRLAATLRLDMDLVRGDHVAIWSLNCYAYILVKLACARIGAICWLLDPNWTSRELERALSMVGHKLFFCPGSDSPQQGKDDHFTCSFNGMSNERKKRTTIVIIDGNNGVLYESRLTFSMRHLMRNDVEPEFEKSSETTAADPYIVLLTSDSTGSPKAVVLSHFAVLNNNAVVHNRIDYSTGKRFCVPCPFFHAFASLLSIPTMVTKGVTLVLPSYRYSKSRLVDVMRRYQCTHLAAVPTMVIDALAMVKSRQISLPHWTSLVTSAATFPLDVLGDLQKYVPSLKDIQIEYGMTEMGVCTLTNGSDWKFEHSGPPLDYVQIKVISEDSGDIVPLGCSGLVRIRSPYRMIGYHGEEEQTNQVFDSEEWYDTGDIGKLDREGNLYFMCHSKEVISRGAQKFFPFEVEQVLLTYDHIKVAVVFGIPDTRLGQEVGAWIQIKRDSHVTEDDVKRFLKNKLSRFKVPSRMVITKFAPPLTESGKVAKNQLLKEFLREKSSF